MTYQNIAKNITMPITIKINPYLVKIFMVLLKGALIYVINMPNNKIAKISKYNKSILYIIVLSFYFIKYSFCMLQSCAIVT